MSGGSSASDPPERNLDLTIDTLSDKTMTTIDQKIIKKTQDKIIISGDFIEHYNYEKPIFYNLPPPNNKQSELNTNIQTNRKTYSIYRTKNNIHRLINTNKNNQFIPKFITYTFAKNIKNIEYANTLWKIYIKKMRYQYGKLQYITVIEFQERGAIHYHTIFFNLPYIKNIKQKIQSLWPYGHTKVKAVTHVKNLGTYLAKYLTKDTFNNNLIKNKAYFTSKNLKKPIQIRNSQESIQILKSIKLKPYKTYTYESKENGKITVELFTTNQQK